MSPNPLGPDPAYFTVRQVAAYFSVSVRTIYRLIQEDKIAVVRIGHAWRVHRTVMERFERAGARLTRPRAPIQPRR